MIAEKRVDKALAELQNDGLIHFWFRAPRYIDDEGIDHIFGRERPEFSVWGIQVTSAKTKWRTYYRRVPKGDIAAFKKPYYRYRYHRYIPLLAVTDKVRDIQIRQKLIGISRKYKSIFEKRRCSPRMRGKIAEVQELICDFLGSRGITIPRDILERNTP